MDVQIEHSMADESTRLVNHAQHDNDHGELSEQKVDSMFPFLRFHLSLAGLGIERRRRKGNILAFTILLVLFFLESVGDYLMKTGGRSIVTIFQNGEGGMLIRPVFFLCIAVLWIFLWWRLHSKSCVDHLEVVFAEVAHNLSVPRRWSYVISVVSCCFALVPCVLVFAFRIGPAIQGDPDFLSWWGLTSSIIALIVSPCYAIAFGAYWHLQTVWISIQGVQVKAFFEKIVKGESPVSPHVDGFRSEYMRVYKAVDATAKILLGAVICTVVGAIFVVLVNLSIWWQFKFVLSQWPPIVAIFGTFGVFFVYFLPFVWLNDLLEDNKATLLFNEHVPFNDVDIVLKYFSCAPLQIRFCGVAVTSHAIGGILAALVVPLLAAILRSA